MAAPTVVVRRLRYTPLLVALLAFLFVVVPATRPGATRALLLDASFSFVLVAAVWALGVRGRTATLAGGLALVALAVHWAPHWIAVEPLPALRIAVPVAFLGFVVFLLLRDVLGREGSSTERLRGAICVYLLLATLWTLLFALCEQLAPGSFTGLVTGEAGDDRRGELLYYSFTTLTTLGYGDIVPLTPIARSLSSAEAVTGQLYLAILVARLVALQVSGASRS